MQFYTYREIRCTGDDKDSWWSGIIMKPFIYKLIWLFANYTKFTPNQITIISFIFGLSSVYFFLNGTRYYLIIGAFLYEFSFILDCVDGRLARLKGLKSITGAYLDIMTDITKYFFMLLALNYGQYLLTNDISFLLYGYVFMFAERSLAIVASSYTIRFDLQDTNRKDVYQKKYTVLNNILPSLVKFKTRLDPDNQVSFLPLTSIEAETVVFFIAPIIMNIKLGIIIGSMILLINMLILIIYNISLRKKTI